MSAIIKSADHEVITARVRPLARAAAPAHRPEPSAPVIPPEILTLRRELEAASMQLAANAEEIERLKTDVGRAFREGEAEGRKAGRKDVDDREKERVSLVAAGVERALERFRAEVASLERLAPALAREALGRLLLDPSRQAELVIGALGKQIAQLDRKSIVRVEVSRADFPTPDALVGAVSALGHADIDIQPRDELERGECRIKLNLGEIDVGMGQQWAALSNLLGMLSEPEAVR